ncbi:hypothetical protein [endosymbiont DhMRE of Dentiscutata heterogama]|nr:hypothetical protein [endosymbiont DhMRE of Dentiscutata heterogama]
MNLLQAAKNPPFAAGESNNWDWRFELLEKISSSIRIFKKLAG